MKTTFTLLAMAILVVANPEASEAQPPTCKAMCQRLADCKMPSYVQRCVDSCKPYEASEKGRALILTFTRYSCEQLRNTMSGARSGSARTADDDDLDRLEKELDDAEAELDRRSRGSGAAKAPTRGAGPPPRGAAGSTPIAGNSRRPAAGGSSRSGDNCAPVCGRFDQCRLWKYDSCMGYCSANTSDPAKNLSAAQWSCPKLGAWMQQLGVSGSSSRGDSGSPRHSGNSGGVTCTAEASVGTTQGNMPTIYRTISAMGNGPSRDAASVKALKDCGALVSTALNLAWLSGEQTEGGNCVISRCTQ